MDKFRRTFLFAFLSIGTVSAQYNMQWTAAAGGTGFDEGMAISTDAGGNVLTTGYFSGTADFDPGASINNLTTTGGSSEIFVSKLDGAENFLWAISFGGGSSSSGLAITSDQSGNVYVTGHFKGTVDFDPGPGVYNLTGVNDDVFICKLNAAGGLIWAKAFGGTGGDAANAIAVDELDNVYVAGGFAATVDFDPSASIYNMTSAGGLDIFISKLDVSGNFVWAKRIGSGPDDAVYGLAIDGSANVYTTGYYAMVVDFDPGPGVSNLTPHGLYDIDAFVSKFDTAGNFIWARSMGGPSGADIGVAIAIDSSGNVVTSGNYQYGASDFDPGPAIYNLPNSGSGDAFVSKLDTSGNFVWARNFSGTGFENGISLALGAQNNIFITGYVTGNVDYDPGPGTFILAAGGQFLCELDSSGTFAWASIAGTSGNGIDVDVFGNIYSTGYFSGTRDFGLGSTPYNITSSGTADIFVLKIGYGMSTATDETHQSDMGLTIFPNPSRGEFVVCFSSSAANLTYVIEIMEVGGRIVYSGRLTGIPGAHSQFFSLPDLAKGIYTVTLSGSEIESTRRIIID
jgi:hypothetical protein